MSRRMRYGIVALLFLASAAFAQPFYSVSPSTVDVRGGVVVQIRGPNPGCGSQCQIAFGGVVSPSVTTVAGGWEAVAPPHDEGAVPITIGFGSVFQFTIERRFGYTIAREQDLAPIAIDGVAGPFGALWTTELWVHSDSDKDVALQPAVCSGLLGIFDCGGDRMIVKANSARMLPAIGQSPGAIGLFLYPPREVSAQISFDLRLVDRARLGSGTSLPVVRESALRRGKLTMLNVPADTVRVRKRLRIYSSYSAELIVRVYDLDTGRQLAERQLFKALPTDPTGPPLLAATIDDDVFPNAAAAGATRLRVEVEQTPPPPGTSAFWAFISVTDNATQQVTVITPQ